MLCTMVSVPAKTRNLRDIDAAKEDSTQFLSDIAQRKPT